MVGKLMVLSVVLVLGGSLPDSAGRFAAMTAASVLALWAMPGWLRRRSRTLSTYVHETSHGLAALVTGGEFRRFQVGPQGGGLCWTAGGHRLSVLVAGYLGTVATAALMLLMSVRADWAHAGLVVFGLLSAVVSLLRAADGYTRLIGLAIAAACCLPTLLLGEWPVWPRQVANLIGVSLAYSGLLGFRNLFELSVYDPQVSTDAKAIERLGVARAPYATLLLGAAGAVLIASGIAAAVALASAAVI